jgi:hypothetical protein
MYIYESPDGGETIYRRNLNDPGADRELQYISEKRMNEQKEMEADFLWKKIRKAAETNIALHNLLEKAKMTYILSQDEHN